MSDDDDKPRETLSKLKHRHEMEIKKLEQANKKSVTSAQKSGKAAKAAAIDAAEVAMTTLQSEHAKQLSAWHAANAENNNDDDNKEEKASNENSNVAAAPAVIPGQQQQQGLSKAAKRRLAKERAEEEHNARVADAAANSVDFAKVEWDQLSTQVAPLRLRIVDVAADGNCLYASLADQARVLSLRADADVASMRTLAADYMMAHADDFAPFLDMPDDCTDLNALLRQYTDKLRTTNEWGGQLELRALAAALKCVVVVHSAGQPTLRMGDDAAADAPELHISYHKKLLALGEHYNSLRPIQQHQQ